MICVREGVCRFDVDVYQSEVFNTSNTEHSFRTDIHIDQWLEGGVPVLMQSPFESQRTKFSIDCQIGALCQPLVLPAQGRNRTGIAETVQNTDKSKDRLGSRKMNRQ